VNPTVFARSKLGVRFAQTGETRSGLKHPTTCQESDFNSKKTTRASCKSLSSPQSLTLTSADSQQSVGVFQGPLFLESGVGESTASAYAVDLVGCLPGFSGAAKHPSLTSPSGELVRQNPGVSSSGGGVTPSSMSNTHSESSRESRRRVSATQTSVSTLIKLRLSLSHG